MFCPCLLGGANVEALYEGITVIPIQAVGFEGAILLIFVVAALIFGEKIPPPNK